MITKSFIAELSKHAEDPNSPFLAPYAETEQEFQDRKGKLLAEYNREETPEQFKARQSKAKMKGVGNVLRDGAMGAFGGGMLVPGAAGLLGYDTTPTQMAAGAGIGALALGGLSASQEVDRYKNLARKIPGYKENYGRVYDFGGGPERARLKLSDPSKLTRRRDYSNHLYEDPGSDTRGFAEQDVIEALAQKRFGVTDTAFLDDDKHTALQEEVSTYFNSLPSHQKKKLLDMHPEDLPSFYNEPDQALQHYGYSKEAALQDYLNKQTLQQGLASAKQGLQSAGNFISQEAKNVKNVPKAVGQTIENLGKNLGNPVQAVKNYYGQFGTGNANTAQSLKQQAINAALKGDKINVKGLNPDAGFGRLKGFLSRGVNFQGKLDPVQQGFMGKAYHEALQQAGGKLNPEQIDQFYQGIQNIGTVNRSGLGGAFDAARKGVGTVSSYLPGEATVKTLGAGVSGLRAYKDDIDPETGRKKGLGERLGQAGSAAGANILTHNVVPQGMGVVPGVVAGQVAGSAVRGLGGAVGRNLDNMTSMVRGRPLGVDQQEQADYHNRMRMARMLG